MARIIVTKHIRNNELTLAICDEELLGKTFSDDTQQLNLTTNFYKGNPLEENQIIHLLDAARSAMIIGENALNIVKNKFPDIIIKKVENVPFGQIFKL